MNITIPFLEQIRSLRIGTSQPTQQDLTALADRSGGGWIAEGLNGIIAAILAGYHTQHNQNDTHATITATGSVSERSRTTAMGVWIPVSFLATNFGAQTGTWTVTAAQQVAFAYMLVGTTMFLSWHLSITTTSGTPTYLSLVLPGNALATRVQFGTFAYNDNGTKSTGVCRASPVSGNANQIQLFKDLTLTTTWGASANLTVAGSLACDVTGV